MQQPFKHLIQAAFIAATLFTGTAALAAETSISVPVTELKFFDTGVGPLKAAVGFGDLTKGAHSTYVKLPAGFVSPLHTHTEDYYGVVITGVVANEVDAQAKDRPLPPGSYWFQKGKINHVTKCISSNECVVFITQPGKFDYVNAQK
ncbi:cupin domain-containing protein [Ampullimonas aquatilis]|uniref:cupin domain-containing protein n=1 Tax=Ampullimonas aquatilis TaxID=1341549 RepID=UPI003C77C1B4